MTMTETRFEELSAAYGAALERWPEGERDAARELLAVSPDAQAMHDEARALDAALDGWTVPVPSEALMARILADAADVSASRGAAAEPARPAAAERPGLLARLFGEWGWRPAGAMMACLAIGFVAGLAGAPAPLEQAGPDADEIAAAEAGETLFDIAFFEEEDSDPFGLGLL